MGISILQPGRAEYILLPFTRGTTSSRRVQLWFDLQLHQTNLVTRKSSGRIQKRDFVIEFSFSALEGICSTASGSLRDFLRQLKRPGVHHFSKSPLPMNAAMQQCIYRITHYQGDESVKSLYCYGQLVELLVLVQLAHIETTRVRPVYIKNEYDKERILYARDYLLTHMDAPPGLEKLAAIVGMNVLKLKCGFKELFGVPPFTYLAEMRLEMARTALKRKQKTVTQIAFELGYASLQHFSGAYKKKYGVSPAKAN